VPNTTRGQCHAAATVGETCDAATTGCQWPARCATDGKKAVGVCAVPNMAACGGG